MKSAFAILRRLPARPVLLTGALAVTGLTLSACAEPDPRSFAYFMEDRIAREGTLVRCDAAPQETLNDIECANARRAEATVALRLERERREVLEQESERKIRELSQRIGERERLAREAALEAVRAEREAYEALWRERMQQQGADAGAPFDAGVAGEFSAPDVNVDP